ncbi:hypothetical protein INT45_013823 [Circinella minor]|uniref:Uncharacterized protein n=1 Tax=Circinella minor TaxID=1195481 RepID=A0A8H7RVX2_9FUNG|nr:hypothetical protein INT45_013823 [Circinella minor]
MCLVRTYQTSLQYEISDVEIENMEVDIEIWHNYLRLLVDGKKDSEGNFIEEPTLSNSIFTSNQHYLSHVPMMIRKMGPLRYYSARCMERMIGVYKQRIKSLRSPGKNASNILMDLASERYMDSTIDKSSQAIINQKKRCAVFFIEESGEDGSEIRGKLKVGCVNASSTTIAGVNMDKLKSAFICYIRCNKIEGQLNPNFQYGPLLFDNSNTYNSILAHKSGNHAAYYVSMELDVDL